jgi:outer membrane receptor protein involved in Fe transport
MHKDHEFGLSYSRRIQRPTYNQLNPFQSFIDLTSYNSGNPYLRPEFINSFELSSSLMQRISLTLSYSRYKDPIVWIIKPMSTPSGAVSVETSDNLESSDYFGLNLSAQQSIAKWWNTVTNFNSYKFNNNGYIGNTNASDGNIAFNLNTNHSFTLPEKWSAELSFFYNSSQQVAYAYSRSTWSLNAGIQKILMDGKATVRMNVTDLFRKQFPRVTSHFINYEQYFTAFRDTRAVNLSIVYRFGKNTVQAARRRTTGVEEEKNRAN